MDIRDNWPGEAFGQIFPAHVSGFVELMICLRREFDGDLDLMLVMAVIGERRLSRRDPDATITHEGLGATPVLETSGASINAHSIAEYTGIPRETVRRKVAALITCGWAARDDHGDLRPTRRAAIDLAKATEATLVYLRRIVQASDEARAAAAIGSRIPE